MGIVSTRTPEGEPVRCPVCRERALVVPSVFPTTDAPCPSCGTLIWFSGESGRQAGGMVSVEQAVARMEAAIRRGQNDSGNSSARTRRSGRRWRSKLSKRLPAQTRWIRRCAFAR